MMTRYLSVDNGIVTVHMAAACGNFRTLLDADLYLPTSWDCDRERCDRAGIPESVVYRVAKQEVGLMDFEGRTYTGLLRHLFLSLLVLGFVADPDGSSAGEKSGVDSEAGLCGVEPAVRGIADSSSGRVGSPAGRTGDPISPNAKRHRQEVPQKAAA